MIHEIIITIHIREAFKKWLAKRYNVLIVPDIWAEWPEDMIQLLDEFIESRLLEAI